ncbi:MAG: hypothetical protein KF773_27145 [Deltaproteobacteria bacterium]|nr:hypothetical protein [Deltaproteobacteria bacterium]MCW5805161.1 hypothetical protein [Deltaproteobacteria bacterium]
MRPASWQCRSKGAAKSAAGNREGRAARAYVRLVTFVASIPLHLLPLLENQLDSFEKLEVARRVRSQPTSRSALCDVLLPHADAVEDAISALVRADILDVADDDVCLGRRAKQDPRFEELMDLYTEEPHTVMSTLSAIALRRIREGAARMLAKRGDGDGE